MSGSVNKVILVGRLGKDPEIRTTNDGREIANLTLATSESWKDKNSGEKKEKTEWHRIACFKPGLVGIIKSYVKKGSQIYVEGQLTTRKWQDQNGQDRYTTEITLQGYSCSLQLLGGNNQNSESQGQSEHDKQKANGYQSEPVDDLDDEIPFS